MKVYVGITGAIFGLITVAHIARMVVEPHTRTEASYIALTALSAALCVWAMSLLKSRAKP